MKEKVRKASKGTNQLVDLIIPPNHRVKLKENEKTDKYLYLSREFKMLWDMKVTVIPVIYDVLKTSFKGWLYNNKIMYLLFER